ncbi:MAG: right-handed parallel beta-helix repeat-containing protein, partial [Bacteroidaceae bacterium]|nr:right-handed parallel beta-helix repeat-containing protein [Bacteroidaceae bacterium]
KGKIVSVNGLYEGMMDDAINVHGTYLKVMKRVDDYTLEGRYMHGQAWGFDWGFAGDKVQFIRSKTMEILDGENKVASIEPADKPTMHGARLFRIRFEKPVPAEVSGQGSYGIENLTWTPEVYFAHNTIRNNRARGALFSTPQKVLVEKNLFDHTSGCAILLCGDCNGWFETGACRNVTIRNNRFINSLTSQFQFTNAVISIYPEIPELDKQQKLFHGGKKNAIRIIDNEFVTFDAPLLYAKSVDGLLYKGNTLVTNNDFPPLHWNRHRFFLQRVRNVNIENVLYDKGNILKEVKLIPCEK